MKYLSQYILCLDLFASPNPFIWIALQLSKLYYPANKELDKNIDEIITYTYKGIDFFLWKLSD